MPFFVQKKANLLTSQHTISYFANVSISYSLETERETLTSYLMRVCLTVDYTSQQYKSLIIRTYIKVSISFLQKDKGLLQK